MYLVFKLHKRGYPVNDVYEKEVKPIETSKFDNQMLQEQEDMETRQEKGESYIEFDSEATFYRFNETISEVPTS